MFRYEILVNNESQLDYIIQCIQQLTNEYRVDKGMIGFKEMFAHVFFNLPMQYSLESLKGHCQAYWVHGTVTKEIEDSVCVDSYQAEGIAELEVFT